MVECKYLGQCEKANSSACNVCKNNKKRNYTPNYFERADDNPIPKRCPELRYEGPAEQTAGYECPVCGGHTNPYHLNEEHLCNGCGYKLNIR